MNANKGKKDFFKNNRKKLIESLKKDSILILFSGKPKHCSADEYYTFVPNKNFYYFTGIEEKEVIFVIEKRKSTVIEKLFVERPNPDMEKWVGKTITKEEAKECSGISGRVAFVDQFEDYFFDITESYDFINLYLDLFKNDPDDANALAHDFADFINKEHPGLNIKDIFSKIQDLRAIKQPYEVLQIRKALSVTEEGIDYIFSRPATWFSENKVEAYFDFILKSKGKRPAFKSIVSSGVNATVLHHTGNNMIIKPDSLVLLDLGAACNYYCSDISRAFPVSGKFTLRQRVIYNIVLKAQQAVIDIVRPGVSFKELNETAKKVLAEGCKRIGLIKKDEDLEKYYYHGISHSLGLDTHDMRPCDYKKRELEEGMVITVEPGLYIKEEGIGIRIEDDILVTKDGYENLSIDIVKDPDEIEKIIK